MSTDFYANQNASAPNVAPVYSLYGEKVGGTQGIVSGGDVQLATAYSTAPYRPPKRRDKDSPTKLLCSSEGCKAWPIKAHPYCSGHARSLGLVDYKSGPKTGEKAARKLAREAAAKQAKKDADLAYRQTDEYKQSDRYKMRVAGMAKARAAKLAKARAAKLAKVEANVDDR